MITEQSAWIDWLTQHDTPKAIAGWLIAGSKAGACLLGTLEGFINDEPPAYCSVRDWDDLEDDAVAAVFTIAVYDAYKASDVTLDEKDHGLLIDQMRAALTVLSETFEAKLAEFRGDAA